MLTALAETPAELDEPAIALPEKPSRETPRGFPFVMVLAPIIVALVLFAVLHSPYVLMFAVFGPVFGIASVIDQRVGAKRRFRKATTAYELAVSESRREIAAAQERLRRRARSESPDARAIILGASCPQQGFVIGTTTITAQLRCSGNNEELARQARTLTGMPVVCSARAVLLDGPTAQLVSVARALVVALLARNPAAPIAVTGAALAGVRAELSAAGVTLTEPGEAAVIITTVLSHAHPTDRSNTGRFDESGCAGLVLENLGRYAALATDEPGAVRVVPIALSEPELRSWLPVVVAAQHRVRLSERALPQQCQLADLEQPAGGAGAANFLVDCDGAHCVNLVVDGPHAVIGGTTGSGKSELLVSWAVALCASHTSTQLNLLCLDFKGGATFDPLAGMPHCTGIVTDLDGDEALRVTASLRAEVQRRERELRRMGLRDLGQATEETPSLARLVVFIDEYQALVRAHPELQEVIADVAARGRSLGIHLVLCTQRATGTFREELLANCAVRLSLRVELVSDSNTLLASPAAAEISREHRGRGYLRVGGGELQGVQVALADEASIARLAQRERQRLRSTGTAPPQPIWHPPLPEKLSRSVLPGTGEIGFGLCDRPLEQRQCVADLRPGQQLFVLGAAGSGRTTTLRCIAEAARAQARTVFWVSRDPEAAWDGLAEVVAHQAAGDARSVVVIDDLDVIVQQFGDDHRASFLEQLQLLLRTSSHTGASVVISAHRITGGLQLVAQLCSQHLRLAHSNRNDWIVQGGEPGDWLAGMNPGRGRLGRDLIQVALPDAAWSEPQLAQRQWHPFCLAERPLAIVARRTAPITAALANADIAWDTPPNSVAIRSNEPLAQVLLGDVEQWAGAYGVLTRVAQDRAAVLIGLTVGEWRSFFRGEALPPVLLNQQHRALLREPNGEIHRVRLIDGVPAQLQGAVPTALLRS